MQPGSNDFSGGPRQGRDPYRSPCRADWSRHSSERRRKPISANLFPEIFLDNAPAVCLPLSVREFEIWQAFALRLLLFLGLTLCCLMDLAWPIQHVRPL